MVHARAAQHRVSGEELLGHRPRLEAEQAGDEAVGAGQGGVPLEEREVRRQVVGRIEAAVQRGVDELIERGAVRVEHRVDLALGARLEPHGIGEAVHLDVGVARVSEASHVGVGIEAALDAGFLRQEDVVAGAVPSERRLQLERAACRQRLVGQHVEHVRGGSEQAGGRRRRQLARAVLAEFEPHGRARGFRRDSADADPEDAWLVTAAGVPEDDGRARPPAQFLRHGVADERRHAVEPESDGCGRAPVQSSLRSTPVARGFGPAIGDHVARVFRPAFRRVFRPALRPPHPRSAGPPRRRCCRRGTTRGRR